MLLSGALLTGAGMGLLYLRPFHPALLVPLLLGVMQSTLGAHLISAELVSAFIRDVSEAVRVWRK